MSKRQIKVSGTSARLLDEHLAQDLNGVWPEFVKFPEDQWSNYFRPDWDERKVGKHGRQCRLMVTEDQLGDIVWRLEHIAENRRYMMACAREEIASYDESDAPDARACEKDAKRIRAENPDLFANGRMWHSWGDAGDDGDDLNEAGFGWGVPSGWSSAAQRAEVAL